MVAFSHRRMFCCLPIFVLLFVTGLSSAEEKPSATPDAVKVTPDRQTRTPKAISASGREIFLREWIPNDPRSHGGDGLGPVFNESSCVSCHNQGGAGGGGPEAKNVTVISAIRSHNPNRRLPPTAASPPPRGPGIPQTAPSLPPTISQPNSALASEERERKQLLDDLRKLHPGLVTTRSVVLHNSGTDPKYTAWRDGILGVDVERMGPQLNRMQPQVAVPPVPEGLGFFETLIAESQRQEILEKLPPLTLQAAKLRGLLTSVALMSLRAQNQGPPLGSGDLSVAALPTQRNSTALFGVGLIDSIPDMVIESAAARTISDFPEITGRVARLKDGRIGRFGWKAQKANLYDFTMTACAVELGLHVPDHPQAGVPLNPQYVPAGYDLNREECLDLVQFLKELPAPTPPAGQSVIASELNQGKQVFGRIGCAACHSENLGEVTGIFSDLLLHDMGRETGDSGSYGVFQPQSSGNDGDDPLAGLLAEPQVAVAVRDGAPLTPDVEERLPEKMIGAGRQEWRTPPLWGVRDSAPYIHDGRAATIEQAIAAHGGEAQLSANRYFRLPAAERASLATFLRNLVAPDTATASQ